MIKIRKSLYFTVVCAIIFLILGCLLLKTENKSVLAETDSDLILDANLTDITMGDATTNGVMGVEFGVCTNETLQDNAFGVFAGNDGTTQLMATSENFCRGQAIVYCFLSVSSNDYDIMEMRVALCNWDTEYDSKFYFFKSGESDLSLSNAVKIVEIKAYTSGERILTFPIEDIKDSNGNVSNITIYKEMSWRATQQSDSVCLDYIKFSKASVLENDQLTNCKNDTMQVFYDTDFDDCIINSSWSDTNHERSVLGDCGFKSGIEGALDGNVYKFAWDATKGLLYPSVFFRFNNKSAFEVSSNLDVRIFIDANANDDAELWFTSANAKDVFETSRKITIGNVRKGEWITVSLRAKDFIVNGEIGDMCVTVHTSNNTEFTPNASFIYFDDFSFVLVEKIIAPTTSYRHYDVSQILPLSNEGYSVSGQWEDPKVEFDYTKFANVAFMRKDIDLSCIKMNMKINDLKKDFEFYYLLRGIGNYYTKGGIYYWFSDEGLSIGINGMNPIRKKYDEVGIKSDEFFELEMGAVPYRVDGIVSGYYGYLKVNGQEILGDYFDNGSVSFGKYFGLLMNTTTSDTVVTIQPVEYDANATVVKLTLIAPDGEESIGVGDYVRFVQKIDGNFVGQAESAVKIISGNEFAEIDEDGYLVAKKSGMVKVIFSVQNIFGEFVSNELTFEIVGETESTGCYSAITIGLICGVVLLLTATALIIIGKNKKEKRK